MISFRKQIEECFYFSKEAKNYFLETIDLQADVKREFDVNYSYFKLQDKKLIINNVCKYEFKTKKQYLEIVKQVNFLNTLLELEDLNNFTIFLDDKIQILCNYEKQNRILNITYSIGLLLACKNINFTMIKGKINGSYSDSVLIQNFMNKIGLKCFR